MLKQSSKQLGADLSVSGFVRVQVRLGVGQGRAACAFCKTRLPLFMQDVLLLHILFYPVTVNLCRRWARGLKLRRRTSQPRWQSLPASDDATARPQHSMGTQ